MGIFSPYSFAAGSTSHKTVSSFTYNAESFLLNGEPYQIIGGQMDPQRVPRTYWRQRLQMARAMGLNTIFSYVFWNRLEPEPGQWNFSGQNDIAEYFRLAQEEDLHVVLRPGPYICGEHDWGGFPAWLSQVPNMAVRQNNPPFLNASKSYITRLAQELKPMQITYGGPILMVQLENEYGSFGSDKTYLEALATILRDNFDLFLYTNDGGGESYLSGGQLHGVLAETDGDPRTGFAARDKYVTDPTSLGPLLDGEYYVTWLDTWASNYSFETDVGNAAATKEVISDLDWILSNNNSFSLYMFHGGTNLGFDNGGIWGGTYLEAVTTSYDYGAPLDESGRPTEIYYEIRDLISKYVPAGSIPAVPALPNLTTITNIKLEPSADLFDILEFFPTKSADNPLSMEALGQSYGFVLYEHIATEFIQGTLTPGIGIRDRVIVYVNSIRIGVMDSTYTTPSSVTVSLQKGDYLHLLVENLGRVDYGQELKDQTKGIIGNVTVGINSTVLTGWSMYSLQLDSVPTASISLSKPPNLEITKPQGPPVFYYGSYRAPPSNSPSSLSRDTFLSIPSAIKGVVWVNGINIGRYWTIGPQQSLYVPGCFLHDRNVLNEILVLELEPQANSTLFARGLDRREWFNNPDPDAP
ncbi:putative beta-calactosidase [Talaromyces proteolyticus]|uniref:Beta-galactosidase n=1 Tax=Talaromyces proteolyticus TaxID=1131652 RepID=A0AAD4KH89_9EURO|nr:putative beta-calactosidase [Talaromyces proteolyticus]KAH8691660.1 putative beta-calactosidase [Talaromyces proteolyticus]